MDRPRIRTRERDAIVRALSAGVVPRVGLQHIQVGRSREIEELLRDMDRIAEGGSTIRFIIGEYGSGKTFFLNLVRQIAMEKRMVVLSADISPDRRLHATGGQARSLYAEMARNTSTISRQDGGAMPSVVERFATEAVSMAEKTGRDANSVIREKLAHLEEMVGGYDFATVISRYWEGYDAGNEDLKTAALRWLRGEYSTRTEARRDLGVRTIVDDANLYDQLKLMAGFAKEAGYQGVVVSLDEMVNLYKLVSSQARQSNYEQILRILNDVLQGTAQHVGFLMGGTPEFLMDTRRGLYSYAALQSRLSENTFARDGMVDLSGPVIRLANLTPEDMFVLLTNIRRVMQDEDNQVPDEALTAFMTHCSTRIGDAYFRTPRNTVKEFVNMLSVLEQNPGADWRDLVGSVKPEDDGNLDSEMVETDEDDELVSFKL